MADNKTPVTADDVQKQILLLQLKELQEQQADREERRKKIQAAIDQEKAVSLAATHDVKRKAEQEKAFQETCPHIKENGRPRIVGVHTGDHSKGILYQCLHCNKEFTSATLPPHLQPHPIAVGGVILGL